MNSKSPYPKSYNMDLVGERKGDFIKFLQDGSRQKHSLLWSDMFFFFKNIPKTFQSIGIVFRVLTRMYIVLGCILYLIPVQEL